MRRLVGLAAAVSLALLVAGCPSPKPKPAPSTTASPTPSASGAGLAGIGDPYYPEAGNAGYDVSDYDLTIRYEPASHQLNGRALIKATATQALTTFDLDLHGLTVDSVAVNGSTATFARQVDELIVATAPIAAASGFSVDVKYHGVPTAFLDPVGNIAGGFITHGSDAVVIGEPEVASAWYPVNDHPLDKATYHIAVTVPRDVEAILSGHPDGMVRNGDNTDTWRWSLAKPAASYLVSMVIGQYTVTQSTHNGKPMLTAIPQGHEGNAADQSIKHTGQIADFLETQFGPYPFDAYGGVVIAGDGVGYALESQERPFYSKGFFDEGVADWVVAHELAHEWYGDSVSVHHWSDVWLNEGFATFAEWLWEAHADGTALEDIAARRYDQIGNWNGSVADPGRDRNFNTAQVYLRGAMVLYALRVAVGADVFGQILKGWAQEKKYGNASTADFVAFAEQTAGRNLTSVFDTWLYGSTRPKFPEA